MILLAKKKKKQKPKLKDIPQQASTTVIEASGKGIKHWAILMILVFCVGVLLPLNLARNVEIGVAVFGVLIILGYILLLIRRKRTGENVRWSK